MADKQFKDWTNTAAFARQDRIPINKFSDDKDYHIKVEDLIRTMPAWDGGITYADGEFITYNDKIYYSIQAANLNKNPASEPTYWTDYGSGAGRGIWVGKSANYTITDIDEVDGVLMTSGATDKTVILPTAADNDGRIIELFKVDAGAGKAILDGEGAETINGRATIDLYNQYEGIRVVSDGSKWIIQRFFNRTITNITAYLSSSQSVGSGVNTKLNIDAVSFDALGEWDTVTNYEFVAKYPGYYQVSGSIVVQSVPDQKYGGIYIYKNGSRAAFSNAWISDPSTNNANPVSSKLLSLAAGDTVDLRCQHNGGSALNVLNASDKTWITIHRVYEGEI